MWRSRFALPAIAFLLLGASHPSIAGKQRLQTVGQWKMFEVSITNSKSYANPFADVTLEADLKAPSGRMTKVYGFYDGEQTWRLRFMPDEAGQWKYDARFSDGPPGFNGTFRCVKGDLHGPLRVNRKNPLWFEYADGTPCYLRAFHIWDLGKLDPTVQAKTLDFAKSQGFNAVCGPHMGPPDNMPWEGTSKRDVDFYRLNLEAWQGLDRAIEMLAERDMVLIPFSIFGGTNGMPKMLFWRQQDMFLRYWVARWGGYWNVTFQPTSEWEESFSEAEILRIGERLQELDHGRHLISAHSLRASSDTVQQAKWYGYHTVQDKLIQYDPIKYTSFAQLHEKVQKPILAHECLWEGNLYQKEAGLDMDNMRKGAWVIALSGAQINYADEVMTGRRFQLRSDYDKCFSWKGMAMEPQGLLYEHLEILFDFMQSLSFSRMGLHSGLSSTGICLAEPGRQYVIYAEKGGKLTLDLSSSQGTFAARWINPRDGKRSEPFKVEGGARREFQSPDDNDWALLVSRN